MSTEMCMWRVCTFPCYETTVIGWFENGHIPRHTNLIMNESTRGTQGVPSVSNNNQGESNVGR